MTVLFKRAKYHRGSIYCMDWSPDGRLLATGSNDKSIKILQFDAHQFTQTGEDIELNFHSGTVRELAFVPNKPGILISGGTGNGMTFCISFLLRYMLCFLQLVYCVQIKLLVQLRINHSSFIQI